MEAAVKFYRCDFLEREMSRTTDTNRRRKAFGRTCKVKFIAGEFRVDTLMKFSRWLLLQPFMLAVKDCSQIMKLMAKLFFYSVNELATR